MPDPLNRSQTIDRIMEIKTSLRKRSPSYPPCRRELIAGHNAQTLGILLRSHEHDLIHLQRQGKRPAKPEEA